MTRLVRSLRGLDQRLLARSLPPPGPDARPASVLILLGDGPEGPDVLLLERAHDMRSHAGQVAFPGGAQDADDPDAAAAALREAHEETGLDPAGVDVCAVLAPLWLPPSNFAVTPVVAFWSVEAPVHAVDMAETASVHRVPLAQLADPGNRFLVRNASGYVGPAFAAQGLYVWGFTAGLLAALLQLGGWERPWDDTRVEDLPPTYRPAIGTAPHGTAVGTAEPGAAPHGPAVGTAAPGPAVGTAAPGAAVGTAAPGAAVCTAAPGAAVDTAAPGAAVDTAAPGADSR
jgi:8-oxo-dGTP pyrophosphatase MutT (NUDIX family)